MIIFPHDYAAIERDADWRTKLSGPRPIAMCATRRSTSSAGL